MTHCLSFPRFRSVVVVLVSCLLWLGCLLWLVGCTAQLPPAPPIPPQDMQQVTNQLEVTSQIEDYTTTAYKIEVGDLLHIDLPGYPELSRDILVNTDGTFAYSYIGTVQVRDLTLSQLEAMMVQRLAEEGVVALDLSVTVVEYGRQQVHVLGAVRLPGVYPLHPGTTLLSLLAEAGGLTAEAGWLALVIKDARKHPPGQPNSQKAGAPAPVRAAVRLDLQKILIGEGPPDFRLVSGDTLFIPQGAYYQVMGRVKHPGRYRLQRDTTVLKAISQAGGFTAFAAQNRLKVWRYHVHNDKCGGELCLRGIARFTIDQPREFRVHMHDVLQPGDVLVVPGGFLF
jgi:polysaccharide biosynthesis/export protein